MSASKARSTTNLRLYLLAGLFVLWCCGICARLVYLQIFRYGTFEQRAQHQQNRTQEVSARRGVSVRSAYGRLREGSALGWREREIASDIEGGARWRK